MVIIITDKAAVAEGATIKATCNTKSWETTIKNGRARISASEIGKYAIIATTPDGTVYSTILVCTFFGQFSTDIYSGSLVVTCIEEAGEGKSCNVRSCDDTYKVTDLYNLTQTFDSKLELIFLGIPSGKYLVTVDDKYVFYKHIESIENTNYKEVELKQWLYKNGDQCPWNTGGWMICHLNSETHNFTAPGSGGQYYSTNASAGANAVLTVGYIDYTLTCKSPWAKVPGYVADFYSRANAIAISTFGTVGEVNLGTKYKTLHHNGHEKIEAAIRSGTTNEELTEIDTATILVRGVAEGLDVSTITKGYLVLGNKHIIPEIRMQKPPIPDASLVTSSHISEIYLV